MWSRHPSLKARRSQDPETWMTCIGRVYTGMGGAFSTPLFEASGQASSWESHSHDRLPAHGVRHSEHVGNLDIGDAVFDEFQPFRPRSSSTMDTLLPHPAPTSPTNTASPSLDGLEGTPAVQSPNPSGTSVLAHASPRSALLNRRLRWKASQDLRELISKETVEWLKGLAKADCVFIELHPNAKQPKRRYDYYIDLVRPRKRASIQRPRFWLQKGSGVGIIPAGDIWILDVDEPTLVKKVIEDLMDARIFAPRVLTPSGGAHFYFRFPANFPLEGMKNHINHPKDSDGHKMPMDFKLGTRTHVVAPGTQINGRPYEPQTPWVQPPVLDPHFFLPDGQFWHSPKEPYAKDDRPRSKRIGAACAYLRSKAPISISGMGGRRTLAHVAAFIVAFLDLDPALACSLLTDGEPSWNSRCRYPDGTPYPWSADELWNACKSAVDAVPAAGVKLLKERQARQHRDQFLAAFIKILGDAHGAASTWVMVNELHARFKAWSGEVVTATAFGRALTKAGFQRRKATRAKIQVLDGIDPSRLATLLPTHPINTNLLHMETPA